MKKSFLEKIVLFFEKHTKLVFVLFLILIVLAPIVIFVIYSLGTLNYTNPISADGIIGYCGAIIGAMASMLVSFIALYESKKRYEAENEDVNFKRCREIRPDITIEFEKTENKEYFNLKIKNISNNHAKRLHLFESYLCAILPPNEEKTFKVAFGECTTYHSDVIMVSDYNFYEDETYCLYPKYLLISLYDKDNNTIFFDYIINQNGAYQLEYSPYIS